jgi:tetratricopeptide (TPR) repeat protein
MIKLCFIFLFANVLITIAPAQDFRVQIYNAYLDGRMDIWKEVMDKMNSTYQFTGEMALLLELAEAEYGYIAYCLSMKRKQEAERYLRRAEQHIEALLQMPLNHSRIYSLKGAFYGFRIRIEPLKAPRHGKKSIETNQTALQLDPDEPMAWMEKANIEYFKPFILGGSTKKAVPLYEKAIQLFEKAPERTIQNWIYLNCLAGLGMAYEKNGQVKEAGDVYRKLLGLEPSFSWIRDQLYPEYLKKHSQQSSR